MNTEVMLVATSAMGLESIVAREVKQLGYEPKVDNGKISFTAPLIAIPRANLWLRTADRLKLIVGEQRVETFTQLYDWVNALPWENFIPEDGEFPVIGKSHKSKLFSVSDCQAITKRLLSIV